MKKDGKKRRIIIVIIVLLAMWVAFGTIDYFRVSSFERPLFCMGKEVVYRGACPSWRRTSRRTGCWSAVR